MFNNGNVMRHPPDMQDKIKSKPLCIGFLFVVSTFHAWTKSISETLWLPFLVDCGNHTTTERKSSALLFSTICN